MRFHGNNFFEEEVRVPFVMKLPLAPPSTVEVPVSLIDIAPTLVTALEMDVPAVWQGQDLMPLVRGDPRRTGERPSSMWCSSRGS